MDEDDSLVRRRSRRSTAGNRMEAALAELNLEDVSQEAEEDNDFVIDKGTENEEDVFGSDFESTDDEAAQVAPDAGDKAVQEEERREKKTARTRVEKATAVAHARQKVTFNPEAYEAELSSETAAATAKKKRRVSLGLAIDVETGEVVNNAKRQSRRSHTILNTSATASRMKKDAEDKKAIPKKTKVKARALTQDELIARALDMEEGNISEHKNYLSVEEEKRKRAHVVRTVVQGPLLRWVSKREDVVVPVVPLEASTSGPPTASGSSSEPPKPEKTETIARNYVIHEFSKAENAVKPPWKDTMSAMFGDSVDWENMKVYATKGRPLTRPVQQCPITGQPARYLDPRTNVPYATPAAYRTLTKIINHEYVWSAALGCYTSHQSEVQPQTVQSDPPARKRSRNKSKAGTEPMDVS
ncbi:hypothetical protein BV25DRAFT_1915397 [Artomyces pyxidatus]|uniref:Uncharacterized protein n=1 Tax=Artomyces pyxidatus TaxID=48021 RepID=A0ACB8T2X0_9AGAM|nr:hypothetical protein BV25DRAFT_1915397 [Artomyces pyxidatus]